MKSCCAGYQHKHEQLQLALIMTTQEELVLKSSDKIGHDSN